MKIWDLLGLFLSEEKLSELKRQQVKAQAQAILGSTQQKVNEALWMV
jgi:hypothetical protein